MRIFRTGLGLGDVLLATGVIKAFKRCNNQRIIVETIYPEIFYRNTDIWNIWPDGRNVQRIQQIFGKPIIWRAGNYLLKGYDRLTTKARYPFPCNGIHLIDAMAESVRIKLLPEERRPYIYLTNGEKSNQNWAKNSIVVQSSSTNYWTVNKHWISGRMQAVVNKLKNKYKIIHLGSKKDEKLDSVIDLRGITTIREAAAILSNSRLFIGLEGGLVHLARAVEIKSVVVYTEYTRPEETGYEENINLRDNRFVKGCWKREFCEDCRKSAESITVKRLISNIQSALN